MNDQRDIIKGTTYSETVKRAQQKYYLKKKDEILTKNKNRYIERTRNLDYKKELADRAKAKRKLNRENEINSSDEQQRPKRGRPKIEQYKLLFNKVIKEMKKITSHLNIYKLIR